MHSPGGMGNMMHQWKCRLVCALCALAMLAAGYLAPRLEEGKLQKGAIVLFLLGGVSIIVKSLLFHT